MRLNECCVRSSNPAHFKSSQLYSLNSWPMFAINNKLYCPLVPGENQQTLFVNYVFALGLGSKLIVDCTFKRHKLRYQVERIFVYLFTPTKSSTKSFNHKRISQLNFYRDLLTRLRKLVACVRMVIRIFEYCLVICTQAHHALEFMAE